MTLSANRRIKGYELRERIGAGGFGEVYRAIQLEVSREVAIKVILPEYANQPDFIRRFDTEAQLIARLEHPHIVPLYDYWRGPDGAYLVMRWLRSNLRASLTLNPWSVEAASRLLDQVADALTLAHRAGIIHRDIKPDNILLDEDDNAYLADFGIAIDTRLSPMLLDLAAISPSSITPEQIRGEAVTARTDIYSLGVVLYELLTGQTPYPDASTTADLMDRHLSVPLPRAQAQRAGIPDAIDAVLQAATAKDPALRYPSAGRFAAAFRAALPDTRRAPTQPLAHPLTERELAILRLMVEGHTNPELASELFLSPETVKWYSKQIYSKLDVHSRRQAIERAQGLGLFSPTPTAPGGSVASAAVEPINPYKGLRAFQESDAPDFFGREALTARLLDGLSGRFLAVVGPSGSGKSSLVKAGLMAALRQGRSAGSERWFITEMVPGAHPFAELEAALMRVSPSPLTEKLDPSSADPRGLSRAAEQLLPTDAASELLLVIDQFEELFTLTEDAEVRSHFIDTLIAAVNDPGGRVRLILTLRADFYDRPLASPGLAELMRARTEVIVPLSANEIERAISGPAERVGLTLEPGLVATMVKDVGAQAGTLPLLEYALSELYERRDGPRLTLDAYQQTGGISGALARRADELFEALDGAGQAAARQLFLRLITLGEGVEDTRRRVLQSELDTLLDDVSVDDVLSAFGQYRLLTFDRDPLTRSPTVEIAHEALIRAWGRLRAWLADSREALRIQRRLMASASEWLNGSRDASFLASGARLLQFEALAAAEDVRLNQAERDYVTASAGARDAQADAERERQTRELRLTRQSASRLRTLVAVLALFLLVAAGLSGIALNSRNTAIAQGQSALDSRSTAVIEGQIALDNGATAQANFVRAEAQRLAAESNALRLQQGNSEVAALLAVRSMQLEYTPQGDEALVNASFLDLPSLVFKGDTGGTIRGIDISPDNTQVLTASDTFARLWDAKTGILVRMYLGHADVITAVAFSPDGKTFVTASRDMTLRLWNTSGGFIRAFVGHTQAVEAVKFSPDGKTILSGSDDKTARLWDVATGQPIRSFIGHSDGINGLAISPDGRRLATASADKTICLWDITTGQPVSQIETDGNTNNVVFSHHGQWLASSSEDLIVHLYDTTTWAESRQFKGHLNNVRVVAFSADDQTLLSSSDDNTVRLWDVATGQQTRLFTGQTSFIWGAAFSPDNRYIISGGGDGTLKRWEIAPNPRRFEFSAHNGYIFWAVISPDDKTILTSSFDQTARLWDIATHQEIRRFYSSGLGVSAAVFSPDGKLILTSQYTKYALLWDAQTGALLHEFDGPGTPQNQNIAFSPDGRYALIGDGVGVVHLFDVKTWQEVRRFVGHSHEIYTLAYGPDGKTVFTGTYDGTARLWDVATGKQIRAFDLSDESGGNSTAYSPDGQLLAVGTWGGAADIYAFANGKLIRRLVGHINQTFVRFSPDGKYLMTNGYDGIMRLWDVTTWQEVRRIDATAVTNGAFSPDSRYILDVVGPKTAELIPVDWQQTLDELCSRLTRDFSSDERKTYDISGSATCPSPGNSVVPPASTGTAYPSPTLPVWTPLPPTR